MTDGAHRLDAAYSCPILHVDMDAFYASVMIRDRPELHTVPVIVGGGHRGVVLSATYLARAYGVRSAMPMTRARRMCPRAVVLAPDYALFESVSSSVMHLLARYTPLVQPMSLDEAVLDLSGRAPGARLLGPWAVAEEIRARVHDEQGITCSVGLAATLTVAKMASTTAKPDGVMAVPPEEVTRFLHPLEVEELWGVGEKTGQVLRRLGLTTVGAVAHTPIETLRRALGPAQGGHLHRLAWGEDGRSVATTRAPGFTGSVASPAEASMGANETFGRDTDDREVVVRELLRLSARVGTRLRAAGVVGRTVTVTVRFADFTTITRSRTMREHSDVTRDIHLQATALYDALGLQRARVRLVGVRVEGLRPRQGADRQLRLGERERGWGEADRAADQAVRRFGTAAVGPASLLDPGPHRGHESPRAG